VNQASVVPVADLLGSGGGGGGGGGSGGGADNKKALAELVAAQDKQIQLMADQIALLKRAALQ
jgi:hypothetical protein